MDRAASNKLRAQFPDIEPVFVRLNTTGNPSFKNRPFSFFKAERPDTNFYDDCHEIYCQLLSAERQAREHETRLLVGGNRLSAAFGSIHPVLVRAGEIAKALHEEAQLIPEIWRRFLIGKYRLTPVLLGYYTKDQLEYRPLRMPGLDEITERPFMNLDDRKKDDIARAEARVAEMGTR